MIPMELRNETFVIECDDSVMFEGDFAWSTEAVGNILKNCMEHTPEGGTITMRGMGNAIFTSLEISDNGEGIDRNDLPHIFERFYVGKHSSENSVGIGLALAKMIVQEQNGTIEVENLPQSGVRFRMKFYKSIV